MSSAPVAHGADMRQDLQGLRGIAVLLVVLFHAGVPGLGGGFVGVDVFFVISGYLISGLLLRDVERFGHIDFAGFFSRRAKRLLPAVLLLLLVVMLMSVYLYPPAEQRTWMSAARAASLYLSNVWLAGRALDYFASETHGNPLLHTWSLSVEEQFYLIWPFVLWALLSRKATSDQARRRRLVSGVAVVSGVSLLACIWLTDRAQPQAFFGMPFRAWEFGLGALVAFGAAGARSTRDPVPNRGFVLLGWIGLALVVAAATQLNEGQAFPGVLALLPAIGTALILLAICRSSSALNRFLAVAPLARLGDLSYSWYLWHWPLLVWFDVQWPQHGWMLTAVAILMSLALAQLSLSWVENPVRRARLFEGEPRRIIAIALAASLAGALLAWALMRIPVPSEKAAVLARYEHAAEDKPAIYAQGCHQYFFDRVAKPCSFGSPGARYTVVLFGDSHAAQWFPAFLTMSRKLGWRLITMTKAACPALDMQVHNPVLKRNYSECEAWRAASLARMHDLRPQLVVLSSANYYAGTVAERAQALAGILGRLGAVSTMQIVLRDTPRPGFDVPNCLARAVWRDRAAGEVCSFERNSPAVWREEIADAERATVAAMPAARYLDLSAAFCERIRCPVQQGNLVLFSDAHHLTASFSQALAPTLSDALRRVLDGRQASESSVAR